MPDTVDRDNRENLDVAAETAPRARRAPEEERLRSTCGTDAGADNVARASGIAMERYGLDEDRALALVTRLAKRRGVAVGVIALAVIAASQRRAVEDG